MTNNSRNSFKIILLGDSGVGKTSMINQFVNGRFQKCHSATVGTDFFEKNVEVSDKTITLQIWDTAGQERFQSLGNWFYRGTDCCLLVYDVTRPETLASIDSWRSDFLSSAEPQDPLRFPFIIVGNKTDLLEEGNEGCQYKKTLNEANQHVFSFLTSAKDSKTVHTVFKTVAEKVVEIDVEKDYEIISLQDIQSRNTACCSN